MLGLVTGLIAGLVIAFTGLRSPADKTKDLLVLKEMAEASRMFYEDFEVGDIYEHWPGRTITETDNIWFTNLTMNTHPLHFDLNYAAQSEFGKPLVNSTFTIALVAGMTVSSTSQKAIANLGWEEIKLPAPVFVGDTLYVYTPNGELAAYPAGAAP